MNPRTCRTISRSMSTIGRRSSDTPRYRFGMPVPSPRATARVRRSSRQSQARAVPSSTSIQPEPSQTPRGQAVSVAPLGRSGTGRST
jgi:hypothetical protein